MAAALTDHSRFNALHYPPDRRLRVYIRRRELVALVVLAIGPAVAAWAWYLAFGLPPSIPAGPEAATALDAAPGFPLWTRACHYLNLLLLVLLVRSGLSILFDHPRLYWNDHCTPGSEWIRFTPLVVPTDRVWTAKDDARYLTPWLGLPGYRHTVGIARHWHFLSLPVWIGNGLVFVALLFLTDHWRRIVPDSWRIVPEAWNIFVHYTTLHLPEEPNGFYRYNALQQLAYFGVVFVVAPLSFLTGMAMSPAMDNHFRWYPRLFGGRQCARSIHFLLVAGYVSFLAVHVTMVVVTGLARNMNHIVRGTDDSDRLGLVLGVAGLGMIALLCWLAHWFSWRHPRALQYTLRHIEVYVPIQKLVFGQLDPRARYSRADISPHFWPNGKMPVDAAWQRLAETDFRDYRLSVGGLVDNPVQLSIADLKALGRQQQITMHHCIQGWSGIAEWGGLPLRNLMELVRPNPGARVVVFHSFGEGLYGGEYYDTLAVDDAAHEQALLAYEMNGAALPVVHGAPLRLRAENQLGYKMVKWIRAIEFVGSEHRVGKGHGGKNEDDEYYPLVANI